MDIPVGVLLDHWKSYVTTISRNLMELSEQTDVKLIKLKIKDSANGYTGLTLDRASKAVDDLDRLWRYYSLLSGTVDKASILYDKDNFLNDTEHKVRKILESELITLETEHIDISSRGLLSPEKAATRVNLQELLKIMQDSFENVRNTFNEISHAAEILNLKIAGIKNEINKLNDTALRLGLKHMPVFDISMVENAERDPLQALMDFDILSGNVERYKASIKSAEEDYSRTADMLNHARKMLCEIEELAHKSETAINESKRLFGSSYHAKPVICGEVLKSLQDWLYILEDKLSKGFLRAAKVGAQKLESECAQKLETEKENYNYNGKCYNDWMDLKGEFKALLAKLNGLKSKGQLFDGSLEELTGRIQKALYADSVNLMECRQLIERLRTTLRNK